MKTMAKAWKSYEAAAVPDDAGPSRRSKTREAFMAGALVATTELAEALAMSGPDEFGRRLDAISAELVAFADLVISEDV